MSLRNIFRRVPVSFLVVLLFSCQPEAEQPAPELPPTPVLTSDSSWGVTQVTYQRIQESARQDAPVAGVLRRGDVVQIHARVSVTGTSYWLEVISENARGWVPDSGIAVYDSKAQALTASAEMK